MYVTIILSSGILSRTILQRTETLDMLVKTGLCVKRGWYYSDAERSAMRLV